MDAATAAILGAAVGAIGSIGGVWLQQRHQTRRDLMKVSADLGLADYKHSIELGQSQGGMFSLPPLSVYVMYHAEFLKAIAKGEIDTSTIKKLSEKQAELLKAFPEPKN
jgi:hypothetical protein